MAPSSDAVAMKPNGARYFCLRFDVDTPACLGRGAPDLMALASEYGITCSFFINPGRAIARVSAFKRMARRSLCNKSETGSIKRLPTSAKLSLYETVWLAAVNPPLLPRHADQVAALHAQGHEVGLHGGRNHACWQQDAHRWAPAFTGRQVDWGTSVLSDIIRQQPTAFASPGWNTPPGLSRILAERGFVILADSHGPSAQLAQDEQSGLVHVPTRLAGEPGGVGYLEWHRAQGHSTNRILGDVAKAMADSEPLVCLYDHPFYAGVHEIACLRRIIELARDSGRAIVTINEAVKRLHHSS